MVEKERNDPRRLSVFGLEADRRYYDRVTTDLVEYERRVLAYERARIGFTVLTFEDFQAATGEDNEAQFVRWEAVRGDTDKKLHWMRTGYS